MGFQPYNSVRPRKLEEHLPLIADLFEDGYQYDEILLFLKKAGIDAKKRTLQRTLRDKGMRRKHMVESSLHSLLVAIDMELDGPGANLGYKSMWVRIRHEYGLLVKQSTVMQLMRLLDPAGVKRRCRYRLKRRTYRVSGPNFIWHVDGMDKLNEFGFCIHGAIDGFSKKIIWLEVSNSNKDPMIVTSYYMDAVKKFRKLPTLVRSDAGTENNFLETLHMALRYGQGDEFEGEKSFLRGKSVHNQRIEAFWSKLKGLFTAFYVNLFKQLQEEGLIDTKDKIHIEVLRLCFGPLIRHTLQNVKKQWNLHRISKQYSRDIRGGKPNVLYYLPEKFNAIDYGKKMNEEHIETLRPKYAKKPELYMVRLEECVKDTIDPEFKTPCTTEEAYNSYLKLLNAINVIKMS